MHALILNFLFINLLFFLQICSKDVGIYQDLTPLFPSVSAQLIIEANLIALLT